MFIYLELEFAYHSDGPRFCGDLIWVESTLDMIDAGY